jgi:hypothetical protein
MLLCLLLSPFSLVVVDFKRHVNLMLNWSILILCVRFWSNGLKRDCYLKGEIMFEQVV